MVPGVGRATVSFLLCKIQKGSSNAKYLFNINNKYSQLILVPAFSENIQAVHTELNLQNIPPNSRSLCFIKNT